MNAAADIGWLRGVGSLLRIAPVTAIVACSTETIPRSDPRERTRREIAGCVAEGITTPEDDEHVFRAGRGRNAGRTGRSHRAAASPTRKELPSSRWHRSKACGS